MELTILFSSILAEMYASFQSTVYQPTEDMGCTGIYIHHSYTLVLPEQRQGLIWWQKILSLAKNSVASSPLCLKGKEIKKSSLPDCLRLASSVFWLTSLPPVAAAQTNQRIRMTDTLDRFLISYMLGQLPRCYFGCSFLRTENRKQFCFFCFQHRVTFRRVRTIFAPF